GRLTHRVEFVGNHTERDANELQAPGACSRRTSVQSSAYHPVSRSRWRDEDFAGSDSTSDRILRVDWEETDPFEERASWSCWEPAAGGALQGDHVSDSARCAKR